jgi:hypothetical protein
MSTFRWVPGETLDSSSHSQISSHLANASGCPTNLALIVRSAPATNSSLLPLAGAEGLPSMISVILVTTFPSFAPIVRNRTKSTFQSVMSLEISAAVEIWRSTQEPHTQWQASASPGASQNWSGPTVRLLDAGEAEAGGRNTEVSQ